MKNPILLTPSQRVEQFKRDHEPQPHRLTPFLVIGALMALAWAATEWERFATFLKGLCEP